VPHRQEALAGLDERAAAAGAVREGPVETLSTLRPAGRGNPGQFANISVVATRDRGRARVAESMDGERELDR
jgi:hypothetical protein